MSTTPFAITLGVGSSLANKTGSWRVERPVYVDRLPPCNNACPAGENIQGWLYEAEEGNYEAAWRLIMRANPLPAIMGRACFHPCESACNRVQIDDAVGINGALPARTTGRRMGRSGCSARCHHGAAARRRCQVVQRHCDNARERARRPHERAAPDTR